MSEEKYLVAYIIKRESGNEDVCMVYDTLEEAQESYEDIYNWTDAREIKLCKVINSAR
jgi:5-methylcytosine-specific restriction endonuclease McrBC regulatory subunit McrC